MPRASRGPLRATRDAPSNRFRRSRFVVRRSSGNCVGSSRRTGPARGPRDGRRRAAA
ncbi:unnamed protein product [Burkholderia pseudomallei]|nr:unnamed protein product [Burkholderia pseudomallei]VUD62638.1 unnamed protein product [Burkholderia pseudomallei]VUD62880.1 unnamed protein product [Burkholderia pseudomallei]